MKHKIVKVALVLASIAYPLVLFFWQKGATLIFCVLCALWLARAYFESAKTRQVCLAAGLFFAVCAIFRSVNLALLYPSIVSLGFLAVFFYSLKGEAVITRLARLKRKR
ncbi:hypothetical protein QM027_02985 [Campylobacter concisus]